MDDELVIAHALHHNYAQLLVAVIELARHDATGGHIGGTTPAKAKMWRHDAKEFLTWLYGDAPETCVTYDMGSGG